MKAIHNNRRVVVTNRVHKVTKNHILLKKEWWSGTAWLKTDGDYVMYASVKDARNSKQMYNAEHFSAN